MRFPVLFYLLILSPLAFALAACSRPAPEPIFEVAERDVLNRGRELVHGLAACGFCHGESASPDAPLTGGRVALDVFGPVTAPNLTRVQGGLGDWSANDIARVLRGGARPDGTVLSPEVHRGYEWLSDRDLVAVVTYLRTLPGTGSVQPRRDIDFIDRNTKGFWVSSREVRGYVPSLSAAHPIEYGKYLADNVARCASCHSSPGGVISESIYLGGGKEIQFGDDSKVAPGITNSNESGIGGWTEDDIVHYLQTGVTASKRAVDPRFCPVTFFARAQLSELRAIAQYLKTVQ